MLDAGIPAEFAFTCGHVTVLSENSHQFRPGPGLFHRVAKWQKSVAQAVLIHPFVWTRPRDLINVNQILPETPKRAEPDKTFPGWRYLQVRALPLR